VDAVGAVYALGTKELITGVAITRAASPGDGAEITDQQRYFQDRFHARPLVLRSCRFSDPQPNKDCTPLCREEQKMFHDRTTGRAGE
jgi:hypothetical protein